MGLAANGRGNLTEKFMTREVNRNWPASMAGDRGNRIECGSAASLKRKLCLLLSPSQQNSPFKVCGLFSEFQSNSSPSFSDEVARSSSWRPRRGTRPARLLASGLAARSTCKSHPKEMAEEGRGGWPLGGKGKKREGKKGPSQTRTGRTGRH